VKNLTLSAKATGLGALSVKWQRKAAAATVFSDIANSASAYTTNTTTTYTFRPSTADEGASFRAVFVVCNVEGASNPVTLTLTPSDIPDVNFAAAIRAVCPNCIDSCNNLTDDARTLTSLSVPNKNITDLTGVAGFTSLENLNCFANKLTTLPTLPTTLKQLECGSNQLTSIPALPHNLQRLFCQFNQLTGLPALPPFLQMLFCQSNSLTALPSLPTGLTRLDCQDNQLTSLPNFNANVLTVNCFNNKLTSLPLLPSQLQALDCQGNQMYCLPTLPSTLRVLYVDADKVTCLPNTVNLTLFNGNATICNLSLTQSPSVPSEVCKDVVFSLTAKATNGGSMTVKWQRKGSSEANFSDIAGSTSTYAPNTNATYTFTPTLADQSAQYRAVFTSACKGSLTTDIVKLTISEGLHIPDVNFAAAIRADCPTCINACDDLTSAAANLLILNVSGEKITDLTGIGGFTNLQQLDCSNNKLTSLPTLPSNLTHLFTATNQIYCLPSLPNSLQTLGIDADKIFCLPNRPPNLTTNLEACGVTQHPSVSGSPAVGQSLDLTAKARLSGTATVKWQRKRTTETNFSDILNTTTSYSFNTNATYRINSLTGADMGASFRAVFSSSCAADVLSNAAVVGSALPVELLSFKGQNTEGGNLLTWTTAEESNVSSFALERSSDGQNFDKIGVQKSRGPNSDYQFLDDLKSSVIHYPLSTIFYYRLKINDLDGSTTYSKTITLYNLQKTKVKIYPLVVSDFLMIENVKSFEIVNISGQVVLTETLSSGNLQSFPNLTQLSNGIYIIKGINTEGGVFSQKIIKQ
jgi:Leucine-rich repeat (LRR) protein